jgi:hypothetical protein
MGQRFWSGEAMVQAMDGHAMDRGTFVLHGAREPGDLASTDWEEPDRRLAYAAQRMVRTTSGPRHGLTMIR